MYGRDYTAHGWCYSLSGFWAIESLFVSSLTSCVIVDFLWNFSLNHFRYQSRFSQINIKHVAILNPVRVNHCWCATIISGVYHDPSANGRELSVTRTSPCSFSTFLLLYQFHTDLFNDCTVSKTGITSYFLDHALFPETKRFKHLKRTIHRPWVTSWKVRRMGTMKSVAILSNYFLGALLVTLLTMKGSTNFRRRTKLTRLSLQVQMLVSTAVFGQVNLIRQISSHWSISQSWHILQTKEWVRLTVFL